MKLKKLFNHLRIGKGLLCLLALFMMLLAPQGAWATVFTTSTDGPSATTVDGAKYTWAIDNLAPDLYVYSKSSTSSSVSVSEDHKLVVTSDGCTIKATGIELESMYDNLIYKVKLLGSGISNDDIAVYVNSFVFRASSTAGEFYVNNPVSWLSYDELSIEITNECTITGIQISTSVVDLQNDKSYNWPFNPTDNNVAISNAKQQDGSLRININEHQSYSYPFSMSATYSSSDTDVAEVANNGSVTIKKDGSTTITAAFQNGDNDMIPFSYILTVTDEEVSYGLSVAGVSVTSTNAADVLGDGTDTTSPTVSYDASKNTLTLNNATLNLADQGKYGVKYTGTSDFTIKLIGTNSITTNGGFDPIIYDVYPAPTTIPTLTLESGSFPCSLTLQTLNDPVIRYFGSVQGVNGLGTTTTGNLCLIADEQAQYIANTGLYKGENTSSGAVTSATITSGYGLKVAGVWVHDGNKDNVLGDQEEIHKVTFTPAVAAEGDNPATPATLTLNNANFNGTINWTDPSDLKVEILGSNTIDVSYSSFFTGNENANLILATNASNPGQLKLTTCSHGNEVSGWKNNDIIYNTDRTDIIAADFDWWADFSVSDQSLLMFNKKYDLWVDNVRLCSAQSEIVYGQTNVSNVISFDGNHTLTFNNVTANSSNNPFIKNGLSSLEINLVGENSVSCGQLFLDKKTGDDDHNVTFKTNSNAAGTLVVTTTGDEDDPWYEGHDTPTVKDLIFTDEMKNSVRTLTFSAPTPYDLSVAGVRVTNANATEITDDGDYFTGTATYNNETHTLTLNNVAIDLTDEENEGPGIKYWGTANLTIVLNGTNSILVQSGCEPIIYDAAELPETVPTLTFVRGSHPCSLELFGSNSPVIKNFGNVLGVNGINGATGNFLKLDSEDAMAYSQADGLHIGQGSEMSPVTSAHIVSFLLDPKFSFSDSENSGISTGGTKYYNYGQEYTMPVLKRWDDGYQTDLSGFSITYTSSDENVATISNTGAITIVGGGWAEIKAVSQETDVYAADSTWFEIAIRPKDPQISLAKGVYYTGKKIALTPTMPNGKMYYSIGYDGTLTEYTDSITLPVGANDIYAYTSCGTGDKIMRSYGNGHTMFFVYDKPVFSIESGTYDSSREVTITTNIPENDNYASVYYKLNNSTTDSTLYKNGDKITISETTRVCAYYCVQESDKYVSDPVEAYYVIRQDAGLAFVQGEEPVEVAEYIIGGNENLPLPTLQNENNLTVTYSSEDENVATVNASGVVTIVGMGETLITATSEETAEFIEGYASYPLRVYKDLSHDDITVEVADAIYTSKAVTPEVTVKDGNTDITELLNIVYSNNVNAGSNAIVTITPNSELDDPNYYCGSTTANFSIDYRTLADGEVTFHNNWATFYNAVGDVNLPTNTKIGAYIVTEVNNDRVIVTQIKNVPQGVAVLLNNNTTTTTENTSTTGNKLMHASQEVNTSTGSAIYYGLYNGAMKRIYGTIPEGKNYLMLSIAIAPQNAPQLNIVIGNDGNTTGISQTESRESEVENVYDLQGRKIQKPSKNGMYIKNGRKVLINNNNRY